MMSLLLTTVLLAAVPATPTPTASEQLPVTENAAVSDASFNALVHEGTQAMNTEDWATAASAFESAQRLLDEPMPELTYNQAIAHYRQGNYTAAADGFTESIAQSQSPELLQDSVYNLGNSAHQQVVQSLQDGSQGDAQGAIDKLGTAREQLGDALNHYRQAIRSDGEDTDARANAELTWNLMEQLRDMQEQLQQQQDQQQQDQQQQGEQSQQQQDQQQQGEQSQQQQDQQQQGEQSQQQQDQQQQGEQGQQQQDQQQQGSSREQEIKEAMEQVEQYKQELQDAREQVDDDLKQNPGNVQAQDMRDQIDEKLKEVEGMEKELQSELEEEQRNEEDADGQDADLQGQSESEGKDEAAEGGNGTGGSASPSDELTAEEAQRLLQSVRDKERQRRMEKAEAERAGTPITGKDW
jgi:Ca-activated chloride channel family protein